MNAVVVVLSYRRFSIGPGLKTVSRPCRQLSSETLILRLRQRTLTYGSLTELSPADRHQGIYERFLPDVCAYTFGRDGGDHDGPDVDGKIDEKRISLLRSMASQDKRPWSYRSGAATGSSLVVHFIGSDGKPADGFLLCRDLRGFRV